jgi:hypothetical protein
MLDIVKNNPLLSGVENTLRKEMIFNNTIITIITSTTGKCLMGKR